MVRDRMRGGQSLGRRNSRPETVPEAGPGSGCWPGAVWRVPGNQDWEASRHLQPLDLCCFCAPRQRRLLGLEPSGFLLDVVPDVSSNQLLEVFLSGSRFRLTHSRGRVVVRGRASGGGGCHTLFLGGPIKAALVSRGGSSLPPPASRPPGSPGLWPHPSVSASVLTWPPTPRSLLSHQDVRWISSSPGSPSVSHLKPLKGLHLQTPPSDSIPSRLPVCVRCQWALLLPPQHLLLFSHKHPGDRCWRGQPAASTEVSNVARRSSRRLTGRHVAGRACEARCRERSGFAHECPEFVFQIHALYSLQQSSQLSRKYFRQ